MAGITKWFWVTIEGYLRYLLPKFEDLVPTSLGSGAILTRRKCVTVTADYCTAHIRCCDILGCSLSAPNYLLMQEALPSLFAS